METKKERKTPISARVSSAWTKLEPSINRPETRIISRTKDNIFPLCKESVYIKAGVKSQEFM